MEIREVTQYNEKAPFTGYGLWIVFELKHRKAQLIHPIYFTELILSEYEYVKSSGGCLWPNNNTKTSFNIDKFKRDLKSRIRFMLENKRPFPVQVVAKIIAELDSISEREALDLIKSMNNSVSAELGIPTSITLDKANLEFRLRKDADTSSIKGRPLAIVEVLKETGESASMYRINHLVNGRLKTKCKLSRAVTYFVNKLVAQGILEIVA